MQHFYINKKKYLTLTEKLSNTGGLSFGGCCEALLSVGDDDLEAVLSSEDGLEALLFVEVGSEAVLVCVSLTSLKALLFSSRF